MTTINLKVNRHIELLLELYNCEGGTITEINRQLNLKFSNTTFFLLKSDLMNLGVLVVDDEITGKKGRGTGTLTTYKIDKEAIDQLLLGDSPLRKLYVRFVKNVSGMTTKDFVKRDLKRVRQEGLSKCRLQ